jgi:hypothetical protein
MAYYEQNAPNVIERDVWPFHPRPLSRTNYGPAKRTPNMENPSRWTPFGIFQPHPYQFGWDTLGGRIMTVEQADMYDASPNPFPANGVYDQPGAAIGAIGGILRLAPSGSAHPGASLTSGEASPAMYFQAPPVFGIQTVPIVAVGT